MMSDASFLILYFALFAFFGWILECSFYFLVEKTLKNRGFLRGPFVAIYGFGALCVLVVSKIAPFLPLITIIILSTSIVTALEYFSSYILEKKYSIRLWDYSDKVLNLKGRICLKFSFFWMILISLQVTFLQPYTIRLIRSIPLNHQYFPALLLLIYFIVDFVYSSNVILNFSKRFVFLHGMDNLFKLPQLNITSNVKTGIELSMRPFLQFPYLRRRLQQRIKTSSGSFIINKWVSSITQKYSVSSDHYDDFLSLVDDIIKNPEYQRLKDFPHHDSNVYDHCLNIAWVSYKVVKRLNLDVEGTVRGALFHDFFLYNWRDKNDAPNKLHAFYHARDAYLNAIKYFGPLSPIEKDIILRHMWPLTPIPPKYPESFIVCMIDKVVSTKEFGGNVRKTKKNAI